LLRTLSFLSQVRTGEETDALPLHEHDGLQQSQYRVVWPLPEMAYVVAVRLRRLRMVFVCILSVIAGHSK
jgi:hypothetical protein